MHVDRSRMGLRMCLLAANRTQNRTGVAIDDLHRTTTGVPQADHAGSMLFVCPIPTSRTTTQISRRSEFIDDVANMVGIAKPTKIIWPKRKLGRGKIGRASCRERRESRVVGEGCEKK